MCPKMIQGAYKVVFMKDEPHQSWWVKHECGLDYGRFQYKKEAIRMSNSLNSLDCCQPTIPAQVSINVPRWVVYDDCVVQETKESAMRATIDTAGDTSLNYVTRRLDNIRWAKERDHDEKFRAPYPKNVAEAKKWMKEGYVWFHQSDDEHEYCGWEWGKDNSKESRASFEGLKAAYQQAYDTVSVVTDEQTRLKALKDFEAYAV